jgi:hypothetical protein
MPIKELRESIGDIDLLMADDQSRVQIVQKRINLKEGSIQRNMLSMDLFFDDPPYIVGANSKARNGCSQYKCIIQSNNYT